MIIKNKGILLSNKLIGSAFIVADTVIGAGMLAIPLTLAGSLLFTFLGGLLVFFGTNTVVRSTRLIYS